MGEELIDVSTEKKKIRRVGGFNKKKNQG